MEEKKKSANSIDLKKYLDKKYWKIYAAALLALVLLVTVIVLIVGSGNSDNPQETTPEAETTPEVETTTEAETTTTPSETDDTPVVRTSISAEELSNYEIIFARKSSQEIEKTEVVNLFNMLRQRFDVVLNQRSDLYYDGVASLAKGEYEILIGQTNREESETFLANLKWGDYGYGIVGDKLVIAGKNEDGTLAALRAFIAHINAGEDKTVFFDNTNQVLLQKEYPHQSLAINGISVSELSILCNEEALGGVAQIIRDAIIDACGVAVPIFTDEELIDAGLDLNLKKVILIGDTACVCIDPALDEYAYPTGKEYYFDRSFVFCLSITAKNASGFWSAATDLATQISNSESDNIVIESGKREGSDNIAVMSFNLMAGKEEKRIDSVIETILKYRPAVVGVQEATDTWISILRSRLKDVYTVVGEGRNAEGHDEFSAILYLTDEFNLLDSGTKWLSNTPDQKGSKLPESYYIRIMTYVHLECKSDGKQFLHANTHLDYTVKTEDEATQVAQMQILLNEIAKLNLGEIPTVITGDFNAKVNTLVYQKMIEEGYTDAAAHIAAEDRAPTYHGLMATTGEPRHIDFIFAKGLANDNLYRICTERVDNENVSDHYPILSVLSFQTEN